jgi:hypothetical protein
MRVRYATRYPPAPCRAVVLLIPRARMVRGVCWLAPQHAPTASSAGSRTPPRLPAAVTSSCAIRRRHAPHRSSSVRRLGMQAYAFDFLAGPSDLAIQPSLSCCVCALWGMLWGMLPPM